MKPIYEPKGRAKEYGDLALNIYTGCPHRCAYCFAPGVLRKDKEQFHTDIRPRDGILEATQKQLLSIRGKTIHLCFTCDPYPHGVDSSITRGIIKAIKSSGNHVQILTKNGRDAERDFDLLDGNDSFGVTFTGISFPNTIEPDCNDYALSSLSNAHKAGIRTWLSCEPALYAPKIRLAIQYCDFVNTFKIGKLNGMRLEALGLSPTDWGKFGHECESLCKLHNREYYIKEGLRAEMSKQT